MRTFMISFVLFSFVILFFGCSTTLYTSTNEDLSYDATDVNKILVTTNDWCDKKFNEVGFVTTTKTNLLAAKNELKKYAAQKGGDEIINFKVTVVRTYLVVLFIPIPVDNYVCRGTIIRYL